MTAPRCVMNCHVLHAYGAYSVAGSGIRPFALRFPPVSGERPGGGPSRREAHRATGQMGNTNGIDFRLMERSRPISSPRPTSRGPTMAPDAAAAGGEQVQPPKLPPGPRLGPGFPARGRGQAGAGATVGGGDPCGGVMNCHVFVAAALSRPKIRAPLASSLFRHPGPRSGTMAPDAAAAGEEQAQPLKLPPEPRLGPGFKCHGAVFRSWLVARLLSVLPERPPSTGSGQALPSCPDAPPPSCPDLFRASISAAAMAPMEMPGTSPGMT